MSVFIESLGLLPSMVRKLQMDMSRYSRDRTLYLHWDQSMRIIVPRPNITLVHSAGRSYRDWVNQIQLASGHEIVLVSDEDVLLGLPVLQSQFPFSQLAVMSHGAHECSGHMSCSKADRPKPVQY